MLGVVISIPHQQSFFVIDLVVVLRSQQSARRIFQPLRPAKGSRPEGSMRPNSTSAKRVFLPPCPDTRPSTTAGTFGSQPPTSSGEPLIKTTTVLGFCRATRLISICCTGGKCIFVRSRPSESRLWSMPPTTITVIRFSGRRIHGRPRLRARSAAPRSGSQRRRPAGVYSPRAGQTVCLPAFRPRQSPQVGPVRS